MRNKGPQPKATQATSPFNRAVPGFSLTQQPGKWAWEKPPKMTNPAEIVDSIIDRLEEPDSRDELLNMLTVGVSIEEMVNVLAVHGVARGTYSVDVAEIIKGPLAFYMLGLADEYNLPVKLFGNEEEQRQKRRAMPHGQLLNMMKRRNPDLYRQLMTTLDPETEAMLDREEKTKDSFLRERYVSPEEMEEPVEYEMEESQEYEQMEEREEEE